MVAMLNSRVPTKIKFVYQRKEIFLFLPFNMAAMQPFIVYYHAIYEVAGPSFLGDSCILGLGLAGVRFRVRDRVSIRYWLGPGVTADLVPPRIWSPLDQIR